MNKLKELKEKYYKQSVLLKEGAWKEKDFCKAYKIRQVEKVNYEKWRLLNGLIKAIEKEKK